MRLPRKFNKTQLGWRLTTLLPLISLLGAIVAVWLPPGLAQAVLAQSPGYLTAYPTVELSLNLTVVSIDAEITQATQTTEVSVRAVGSVLEEVEFQLPVTEFGAIEQAIAQELKLPPVVIHQLIRYRLN
jgi:hypothetical protein